MAIVSMAREALHDRWMRDALSRDDGEAQACRVWQIPHPETRMSPQRGRHPGQGVPPGSRANWMQ